MVRAVVNITIKACSLLMYGNRSMIRARAADACGAAAEVPLKVW